MLNCVFCNQALSTTDKTCPRCGAALPEIDSGSEPDTSSPPATREDMFSLLQEGRKIEAIRLYREQTGAGLAEAKAAVEALERGVSPPALGGSSSPSSSGNKSPAGPDADLNAGVIALLQQ